jgi:NADH-quinone oxidoreductase subunit L
VHEHEGHGFRPHESSWIMTTPLVILAFLAAVGGVLNLPMGNLDFLHQWLESVPFLEETLAPHTTGTAEELLLIAVSVAFVGLGIFLAYLVYARHRVKAIEPTVLEHGWYVDQGVAAVVGGPGEASWEGVSQFDHKVIDGTVMGAGALATDTGRGLRRFQTGLIRVYAVGIGIGAVLLLGWFLLAGVL